VIASLVVGFLMSVGIGSGREIARVRDDRRDELVALIEARQGRAESLAAQLEDLRARLADAEAAAAAGLPALRQEAALIEAAAGLVALTGPGVELTLADGLDPCPTGRLEDCRVQDVDLQLAVNTLYGLGAEAIAVNGERVIATTAIRSAGGSILTNYRVLVSPYVIQAIGDPAALRDGVLASDLGADFAVWGDVYGLGLEVGASEELVVPAYSGSVRLVEAAVDEDAPRTRIERSGAGPAGGEVR
jgi:uncharacterized protein YlxW (UPF0749 family)